MIIYNVTVTLNENVHSSWLEWLRQEHIPEVLSTRLFKKAVLSRIISNKEFTYTIAYYAENSSKLESYKKNYSNRLRQKSFEKFGESAFSFRTELELIDEFVI
tara:strand:- start:331 stop:639 length:309 start_codon:yes stop_codon:yes gene_type:complete